MACLLAIGVALALGACGNGDGATAEDSPGGPAGRDVSAAGQRSERAHGGACPAPVTTLRNDLERLRNDLAVGLSYDQYSARVKQLRGTYAAIPIDRLGLGCLHTLGTPAEHALNRYVDAANAWGECLADAGCTTATIEPVLQRKWRVASHRLSQAVGPS